MDKLTKTEVTEMAKTVAARVFADALASRGEAMLRGKDGGPMLPANSMDLPDPDGLYQDALGLLDQDWRAALVATNPSIGRKLFRSEVLRVFESLRARAYLDLPDVKAASRDAATSRWLGRMEAGSREVLAHLEAELRKDAYYAMQWYGDGAFKAAAQLKVCGLLKEWRQELKAQGAGSSEEFSVLLSRALKMVRDGARSPGRSSSSASNRAQEELCAAWAEAVDYLEGLLLA